MSAHEAPGAPITPIRREPVTLEELVERRVALKLDQEYIQVQLDTIDDQIREQGIGTHRAGAYTVQVRAGRRLDAKAVAEAYPVAQHPELYKPAIDTASLKAHVAAVELDKFYVDNTPSVVIK
ncbi:hypothetical protein [Microbacterium sp. PA5]|uniref:hypothetical protein n=1 Tax=Microbacterium sp. PA5 TaxID=3416654 RepID=UPI003CE82F21